MSTNPPKLRPRQQRFIAEYLKDLNASQAYKRAGYSAKALHVCGPQLLAKPRIKAEIERIQAEKLKKYAVSRERVLEEIARLAYVDAGKLFDENGQMRAIAELDEDTRRAVASTKILKTNLVSGDGQREEVHEIKLWDKTKALEMLAKHVGLYEDGRSGPVEINIRWISEPAQETSEVINVTPERPEMRSLESGKDPASEDGR